MIKMFYIAILILTATILPFSQIKPTEHTRKVYERLMTELVFRDKQDFIDARRGFIATIDEPAILNPNGTIAYDLAGWDFLDIDISATINPSLHRQSQLNKIHGLFEVIPERIYQVRGFDLANMTFVRTDSGWIIIDVGTSEACAKAAYDLVKKELGNHPVQAVIFTHPHVDHYAGINAIIKGAPNKDYPIIAPEGFFHHATSENIMAGFAMGRRSAYMYASTLEKSAVGNVGTGLGQTISIGAQTNIKPTIHIGEASKNQIIDGVEMEFIYSENTEAPCEIMIYFPEFRAMCTAEIINHNQHNLLTLRGAKVRDGLVWSKEIDKVIAEYQDKIDVSFGVHHWPTWGSKEIIEYYEGQRDLYRYIHDQTLYLANRGYTPNEIAQTIKLPESLSSKFYNRDYYGTVSHNSKAQYQMYFGWYDGNPANLNPLTPSEQGEKYVEAIGGAKKVLRIAKKAYKQGEYRWGATLLNNLVFSDTDNEKAKNLLAEMYTQLAYQSESGPWRNIYLVGAYELRNEVLPSTVKLNPEIFHGLSIEQIFDFIALQINGPKASGLDYTINFHFSDVNQHIGLILKNGVLNNRPGFIFENPSLSISVSTEDFMKLILNMQTPKSLIESGNLKLTGNQDVLRILFSITDIPTMDFNIVTP